MQVLANLLSVNWKISVKQVGRLGKCGNPLTGPLSSLLLIQPAILCFILGDNCARFQRKMKTLTTLRKLQANLNSFV